MNNRLKLFLFIVIIFSVAVLYYFLHKKYLSYPNRMVVGTIEELADNSILINNAEGKLESFKINSNTVFVIGAEEVQITSLQDLKEIKSQINNAPIHASLSSFYMGIVGFVLVHSYSNIEGGTISAIEGNNVSLNNGLELILDKNVVIASADSVGAAIEISKEDLKIGDSIVIQERTIGGGKIIATKIYIPVIGETINITQ